MTLSGITQDVQKLSKPDQLFSDVPDIANKDVISNGIVYFLRTNNVPLSEELMSTFAQEREVISAFIMLHCNRTKMFKKKKNSQTGVEVRDVLSMRILV